MGACTSKRLPRPHHQWNVKHETSLSTPRSTSSATSSESESDVALNCVMYRSFLNDECLSGWEDGSLRRSNWHEPAPHAVTTWQPHSRAVNCLVIGEKLELMYSCSRDTTVAITPISDKPAAETATILRGHQLDVTTVALDNVERMLCSGGRDTQTIFWDLTTSHIHATNTTPHNIITCSTWIPHETLVAQGSEDRSVKLWDPRTPLRVPVQTLRGLVDVPSGIAASGTSNLSYLLTSSKGFNGVGGAARVWDRRTGKEIVELHGQEQDATACCFLPDRGDRELPVTASNDGTITVWDVSSRSPEAEAREDGRKRMVTSVCAVDDRTLLASTLGGHLLAYSFDRTHGTLQRMKT